MSCLQKQTTIYNSINCLSSSSTASSTIENNDEDENRNSSLEEDVELTRNGLRNGLRSQFKAVTPNLNTLLNASVKGDHFSLFDQLIEEAKIVPESDFELVFESSSFLDCKPCNSVVPQLESNCPSTITVNTTTSPPDNEIASPSSCRKVNRRKNQIELIEDFEDFELDPPFDQSMKESFSDLDQQSKSSSFKSSSTQHSYSDPSLKELRNFKNLKTYSHHSNGLRKPTNFKTTTTSQSHTSNTQVRSAERIFIDNNLFKYDDGLVSVDDFTTQDPMNASLNSSNRYVLKKRNQRYIFERIINDRKLTSANNLYNDHAQFNHRSHSSSSKSMRIKQKLSRKLNSLANDKNQALIDKCLLFRSANESAVFDLFTFQDKISPNLEQDNCQTSIVVLVQFNSISVWTKLEPSQTEWTSHAFELNENNQQVFRCTKIDRDDCVCILFLVSSHSLVSLKYCLIDKQTKSVQLFHGETFEVSNTDPNLIHLCFVPPYCVALSIPRIHDHIIDVLIYDQFRIETEFNKSKRIIYMLNNVNNKFSSSSNCFLASDDLDNTFLAIFNQKLFICNVNECNKLPKMISLQKFVADSNYTYFDVLYDKGIFYLFAGNYVCNNVRIIALNIDRCLADKLIRYDIEKCLQEDRLKNMDDHEIYGKQPDEQFYDDDVKRVRLFKRKGDHLLIIKHDDTVALFNMFSDELVYQTNSLSNINQTAIAVLNQKTTILAVLNNQNVVNLVDL